jgi:hypothetical protein
VAGISGIATYLSTSYAITGFAGRNRLYLAAGGWEKSKGELRMAFPYTITILAGYYGTLTIEAPHHERLILTPTAGTVYTATGHALLKIGHPPPPGFDVKHYYQEQYELDPGDQVSFDSDKSLIIGLQNPPNSGPEATSSKSKAS